MFDLFKKILGGDSTAKSTPGKDVPDAHIALSVLLLEAAHVDGECSEEEKEHLTTTLINNYGVPKDEIDSLLTRSYEQRHESSDLFRFTRYMNDNFSKEEKMTAMESVWQVILLDDHLESHEDHFAHKLANLLRLTHKDLIDAKLNARQQLKEKQ